MCVRACVYICPVCACVHMSVGVHARFCVSMHVCTFACVCMCVCTYIGGHVSVHVCACMSVVGTGAVWLEHGGWGLVGWVMRILG